MLGRRFRIEFRSELFFKHTDTRMSSNLQQYCIVKVVGNPPCFTYFGSIKLVSAESLCLISRTIWQKEMSVAFTNFSERSVREFRRTFGILPFQFPFTPLLFSKRVILIFFFFFKFVLKRFVRYAGLNASRTTASSRIIPKRCCVPAFRYLTDGGITPAAQYIVGFPERQHPYTISRSGLQRAVQKCLTTIIMGRKDNIVFYCVGVVYTTIVFSGDIIIIHN